MIYPNLLDGYRIYHAWSWSMIMMFPSQKWPCQKKKRNYKSHDFSMAYHSVSAPWSEYARTTIQGPMMRMATWKILRPAPGMVSSCFTIQKGWFHGDFIEIYKKIKDKQLTWSDVTKQNCVTSGRFHGRFHGTDQGHAFVLGAWCCRQIVRDRGLPQRDRASVSTSIVRGLLCMICYSP